VRKRLVLSLSREDYEQLAELAEREERVVAQEAAYLLRRLLAEQANDPVAAAERPAIATR
jgi:hypothetical protein